MSGKPLTESAQAEREAVVRWLRDRARDADELLRHTEHQTSQLVQRARMNAFVLAADAIANGEHVDE